MEENKKTVEIELCDVNDEECLKFTFSEKFLKSDAESGASEWEDIFQNVEGGEKTTIVWDTLEMTGFENSARVIWQKAIKKLKPKIGVVWLITTSKVIKAGAKLMSVFTSYDLKVVKSEKEIGR